MENSYLRQTMLAAGLPDDAAACALVIANNSSSNGYKRAVTAPKGSASSPLTGFADAPSVSLATGVNRGASPVPPQGGHPSQTSPKVSGLHHALYKRIVVQLRSSQHVRT